MSPTDPPSFPCIEQNVRVRKNHWKISVPRLPSGIVQPLLDSRTETIQRNTKSCYPDFLHFFHSPDSVLEVHLLPELRLSRGVLATLSAFRDLFDSDRRLPESHTAAPIPSPEVSCMDSRSHCGTFHLRYASAGCRADDPKAIISVFEFRRDAGTCRTS